LKNRNFIRNVLKRTLCPDSQSLTQLQLQDRHASFTTGIENFGTFYLNIFGFESEWVTFHTCGTTRGVRSCFIH